MKTIMKAIEICGSARALADAVGVSQQAVHLWRNGGQLMARHAAAIEKATGGKITARAIGDECAASTRAK